MCIECEENRMKECSKCRKVLPATKEYFNSDKSRPDGLSYVCKDCRSVVKNKYKDIPKGYKKCKKCKEILPLKNFNKNKKSSDGIMNICISCQMDNRNRKLTDTEKICIRCNRVLPLNEEYFIKDNLCLDGFRNVCKECAGGSFGYREKYAWSNKDNELLIKYYPFTSNIELINKFFPDRNIDSLRDHATKILNLKKDEEYLKYRSWSKEQLSLLIDNYSFMDIEQLVKLIGKNAGLISVKASDLKLKKDLWWTEKEEKILINKYPFMKTEDLVDEFFPERGLNSVINKVQTLNLKKDKDYLYNVQVKTGIINLQNIPDQKGENNPRWVERIIVKCDQCGEEFEVTPSSIKNQHHVFCSRECFGKWRSENLTGENSPVFGRGDELWTKEMRRNQAKKAVNRLKLNNFSNKVTKPQQIINDLLLEMSIKYECEYDCKYYLVDNYLTEYNLMIEVQGNFFHCNPTMNIKNSRKLKIIKKDKSKHTYIKKYKNIEVLYLWEKDIYEKIDLCKILIGEYINNNGVLNNYHSFNYYLDDNNLQVFDNLYEIGY